MGRRALRGAGASALEAHHTPACHLGLGGEPGALGSLGSFRPAVVTVVALAALRVSWRSAEQQQGQGTACLHALLQGLWEERGVCVCVRVRAGRRTAQDREKCVSQSIPEGGMSTETVAVARFHSDQIIDHVNRDFTENERDTIHASAGATGIHPACPEGTVREGLPNSNPLGLASLSVKLFVEGGLLMRLRRILFST